MEGKLWYDGQELKAKERGIRRVGETIQVRREDTRIKIPALIHLSRLGYSYLIRKETTRNRGTNILTEILKQSVERINDRKLTEEAFKQLISDLREALGADDLGFGFYNVIRNGWNGLKIIDYDKPDANCFQMGTEITCAAGKSRFRPDITIFVNGLPLAMIEVKDPEQGGNLLAEYSRMCGRFRKGIFRRYLQAAQIWVFSNDKNSDEQGIIPREGTYYTTGSRNSFSVYSIPGTKRNGTTVRLLKLNAETEKTILEDNSLTELKKHPDYRRRIAPETLTHRLLTGLLKPERFLFLIRYGIRYIWETDEKGQPCLTKRVLTWEQLEALHQMEKKIKQGFLNWKIPNTGPGGRIILAASACVYLREKMPECGLFWLTLNKLEKTRAEASFRQQEGVPGNICFPIAEEIQKGFRQKEKSPTAFIRRVFFLPVSEEPYRFGNRIASRLRAEYPNAILIRMGEAEKHEKENGAYLLQCADGTLYCGWTNDLENRLKLHNAGKGAKYTRSRRPVKLVYWETCATREEAMSREWQIKHMNRKEKEQLIKKKEKIQ